MQRTKLGMVIINYNDAKTTIELLENIKDYKCLDSIIVGPTTTISSVIS